MLRTPGGVAGPTPARPRCPDCGEAVPRYYLTATGPCLDCAYAAGAPPDDERPRAKTVRAGSLAFAWPQPGGRAVTIGDTRWRRREPKVRRRTLRTLFAGGRGAR